MSELAILGGPKLRTEPYPDWPVWDQRDIDIVVDVVRSGRWGGFPYPGPKTAELARKFSELQGGGYAVPESAGVTKSSSRPIRSRRPRPLRWARDRFPSSWI